MVRNIEYETFRTGRVGVRQAVFALEGEKEFARTKAALEAGEAFVYHLAEGTDAALVAEYDVLETNGILAPRFVGIHCTALGDAQYSGLDAARRLDRLVAVLEPVALRRDDRRRAPRGRAGCGSASARTGRRRARSRCSAS